MDVITLTDSNYKEYINQDVVAFSFSGAGSMGEKCTVYIINRLGVVFCAHFNEEILHEHIEEVCPPLKTVKYGIFGSDNKDKEWCPISLGCGNYLQVNSSIYDEFINIVNQRKKEVEVFYLYPNWKNIVLSIIENK